MKTHSTSTGPFKERPFFSDDEIEALCEEELRSQNLLPTQPGPIRIDRFIEKRFGKAHTYEDLDLGVLGLTRFGPKGVQDVVIARTLEDDLSKPAERRLRTTLAHEVGHGLLHPYLFVLGQQQPLLGDWSDRNAPKVLCREPGLRAQYKGDWWEYQANMVMGTILLPKSLVELGARPYLKPVGAFQALALTAQGRGQAIAGLSELFDVNPAVVRIRLDKLFPEAAAGQLTF